MFYSLQEMRKFTSYTMIKVSGHSKVSLEMLDGLPVATKHYSDEHLERYERERDILLTLNGRFRSPRLLAYDDNTRTSYIEWITGDRLKEYTIQHYLNLNDTEAYHHPDTIKKALELFKEDQSPQALNIKTQIFSLARLLHQYGIVHGDLSSRNFIVTPDGQVSVIDFSLSRFVPTRTKYFYKDINRLEKDYGINWRIFEQQNSSYLKQHYYQSCVYPNGFISPGDGQGSTYRKFRHLGIKSLDGFSFLDIGCAEGAICRYAYEKGANPVVGIDLSDSALSRGMEINHLYGYENVTLKKEDIRNLSKNAGDHKDYDIVTCFSVLHHLLPNKNNRDMLAVVTRAEQADDRTLLIDYINQILAVTNYALFLELPFKYLEASDRTLETGHRFCESIAFDIQGNIKSLGIWHANSKKARFIFRIDKPELNPEIADRILLADPVLEAWRRNKPIVLRERSKYLPLSNKPIALVKRIAWRIQSLIKPFQYR